MGDLSPVESLALGRYRKSIEGFADYANSMERTRKVLLKPRKRTKTRATSRSNMCQCYLRLHSPKVVDWKRMLTTPTKALSS